MDSLRTLYNIIEDLDIPREDVTIVLLYTTPRIDQWSSMFHTQSSHSTYKNFVCKDDEVDLRWELLDTSMNVLKLSKDFIQNGFNVLLIDEDGTKEVNQDPAHVLACSIPGVECDELGWVTDLKEERAERLTNYHDLDDVLSESQIDELETLFLQRDCMFRSALAEHSQFQVVNQRSLWRRCDEPKFHMDTAMQRNLISVDYFVETVQSQMNCQDSSASTTATTTTTTPTTTTTVDKSSDKNDSNSLNPIEESTSNSARKATKSYQVILVLILCCCMTVLGYMLLLQIRRRKHAKGEFDGLFMDSTTKRRGSGGSTEHSSSDEESPNSPVRDGSKGMVDVALDEDQDFDPKLLCKACKLVRIDLKCLYCNGGRKSKAGPDKYTATERSVRAKAFISGVLDNSETVRVDENTLRLCLSCKSSPYGPRPECLDCTVLSQGRTSTDANFEDLNERWNSSAIANSYVDRPSTNKKKIAKKKKPSNSLVVRKLKELAELKNEEDFMNQITRDDESEIDFNGSA